MREIKRLGLKTQGKRRYQFGLFECPACKKHVEKIRQDGVNAIYCCRECYANKRSKRGAYKDKIIKNNYIYLYKPLHPNATGTRKLYVAEHRLIMEKHIGRYLTENEVVHHIDGNTFNNDIGNLVLMTNKEHMKYHKKNAERDKYGKFTV